MIIYRKILGQIYLSVVDRYFSKGEFRLFDYYIIIDRLNLIMEGLSFMVNGWTMGRAWVMERRKIWREREF